LAAGELNLFTKLLNVASLTARRLDLGKDTSDHSGDNCQEDCHVI
jgi:hypothetical protein